ncbi:Protein GrpE [Bienertia sinuspersici]
MAVSLSSTPPFFHPSFSSTKQPSKPHKFLTLPPKNAHFVSLSTCLPFSSSSNLLLHNRHGFSWCFSSQDGSTNIMDEGSLGEEDGKTEETDDKKMWENLETLTKYYKEAVLSGDNQTISEIETVLYKLETEKNDLVEKVSMMTEEITSGKERYVRLQADFDNFRKRSEKERLSVRNDAQGEVIESLLSMVDSFERARQQIRPETDRENQIDTSYQGIYKQFVEIMRSLRVAAIATVGKPFDPSVHEAIAREESEEFKEGIVIEEFRRGFLLGDRLLRPAMVKVSSGPGKKKDTAAAQQSSEQPPPAAAAALDEH